MRLDGFGLFVEDMGKTIRFYRDVLGFEIKEEENTSTLYVDSFEEVDEAYRKAVENGATSVLEPELEPWGQRTCYIADPEGNLIEIGSWNKPYEKKDLTED